MGYTIRIGNAVVESDWNSGDYDEPHAAWVVRDTTHPEAPDTPENGRTNRRDPSYSAWADFCRDVGLYEWMLGKDDGKLRRHPGCQRLTEGDADTVTAALSRFRETHPDAKPGFCECRQCIPHHFARKADDPGPPHDTLLNGNLLRLVWLEWWVRWAVANCERPAIYNT